MNRTTKRLLLLNAALFAFVLYVEWGQFSRERSREEAETASGTAVVRLSQPQRLVVEETGGRLTELRELRRQAAADGSTQGGDRGSAQQRMRGEAREGRGHEAGAGGKESGPLQTTPPLTIPGDGSWGGLRDPAILLFCYNRTAYLRRTLESLAGLEGLGRFSLYVSQDGAGEEAARGASADVARLIRDMAAGPLLPPGTRRVEHWQHPRTPALEANQPGHAWLSQHYGWGLRRVFEERNHSHAVIIEDDMLFSPDFLTYFEATGVLLDRDPSLWCVSSWNDNGRAGFDWQPDRLLRTSYFPGLGWMLRRELWQELGPRFPQRAWDHWMRLDTTAKGRDCVAPEVNRNRNIGAKGANIDASTFSAYLAQATFAEEPVFDWGDLSYLLKARYEQSLAQLVSRATVLEGLALADLQRGEVYLVPYLLEEYKPLVAGLQVWPFPRGHHNYVARIPVRGAQVLLADRRFCSLVPPSLRVVAEPTLRPVAAQRNVNCEVTCLEQGLRCREDQFWFVNSCAALTAALGCPQGCAVELGPDIPNAVVDPAHANHGVCLVAQEQPRCWASHPATARLCACV